MLRVKSFLQKFKWGYRRWFVHHPQSRKIRNTYNLSNIDILPKNEKYFLSIVAIFKGEDSYLLEWIEFHRLMGVEHFFLYDNGEKLSSAELLEPYKLSGVVTHIPFLHREGLKDKHNKIDTLTIQQLAYGDCLLRFRTHLQYLIQLDIDEFIYPTSQKVDTVVAALKTLDLQKTKGVEIDWKIFGNNNHNSKPAGLVIENYTKTAKDLSAINLVNVKSIGNVNFISNKYLFSNVHRFIYRFSLKDIINRLFTGNPQIVRSKAANQLFHINHYKLKSREEFLNKQYVYSDGWLDKQNYREKFDTLNSQLNQADDFNILRFVPALKSRLTKLQDSSNKHYLPELAEKK